MNVQDSIARQRDPWYREYLVTLCLAAVIVILMILGFIFGGANRWSSPLVGVAALVAVASVAETQRTRKANEAMVVENQATRKVMIDTLVESQKMRLLTERARFEDIKPRMTADMAEYSENGNRKVRIVFRNDGRGPAILRGVTLTEHWESKFDEKVRGDNRLHHSYPEIIIRPHSARHTNLRDAGEGDLLSHWDSEVSFVLRAEVHNINDELITACNRTFAHGVSDIFAEKDHGTVCGEWLDEDGGYGAIR